MDPRHSHDAELSSSTGGVAPGLGAELLQDGSDVGVHGSHRDEQLLGDLGVGSAIGQKGQDIELASGETGEALPGLAVVGGCCGTDLAHVDAISAAIAN